MATNILPLIANHIRIKLPQILIFKEYMSYEQVPALNAGNLDIGLTRLPKDLNAYSRVGVKLSVLMKITHYLKKMKYRYIGEDFIMYDAENKGGVKQFCTICKSTKRVFGISLLVIYQ